MVLRQQTIVSQTRLLVGPRMPFAFDARNRLALGIGNPGPA